MKFSEKNNNSNILFF